MNDSKITMEELTNFCKNYGFIFQEAKFTEDLQILGILVH